MLALPLLLTACTPDSSGEASATPGPTPAASSAATIPGLRVLGTDPAHTHTDGPLEYDAVPPLGGPHNERWLACDVYDEPVPEEFAVHSMEHGGVWLTYRPGLADAQVARLAALAERNREYVLVSPLPGLPSPVVAAAWGRELAVQDAGDPRLTAFVEQFAGGDQGGEPGVPCRTGGLTRREAEGLLRSQS